MLWECFKDEFWCFVPVSFSFVIPKGLDVGDYSFSVSVWDRSGLVQSLDIPFIVRSENYGIAIKEILLGGVSSGAPVVVGGDIVVRARLENSGLSDEDVRVEFSIPSLGVSDVVFVDGLRSGDSVTSSDVVLSIPSCFSGVDYVVSAVASFRDGRQSVSRSVPLIISGCSDTRSDPKSQVSNLNTQVSSPKFQVSLDLPDSLGVVSAGDDFSFAVRVSNTDLKERIFNLGIVGGDSVGDIFVSPSVVVIPSMSSESVRVEGVVDDDSFGERIFFVSVSSLDGSESMSVPVSVDIQKSFWGAVRTFLEVLLIILVVVLLFFVFFMAWKNGWF